MNFTERTKKELCGKRRKKCCERAALYAFARTAGSIVTSGALVGLSFDGQSDCLEYFAAVTERLYHAHPVFSLSSKGTIANFTLLDEVSKDVLVDLGILTAGADGLNISLEPDPELAKDDCCKRAYLAGAFSGGGSVTVPSDRKTTGYHLEFSFSSYSAAEFAADILATIDFLPKVIKRKDNWVVYFKQSEEIKNVLAYMGASKSVLDLSEVMIEREMSNKANRETNCFIYNTDKTVIASIRQCSAIKVIASSVGLEALPEELEATARARAENSTASLNELAEMLGITKSCLNHRLRRLVAIAETLK